MKKRIIIFLLVLIIVFVSMPFSSFAEGAEQGGEKASSYLDAYSVSLLPGHAPGKLILAYQVYATRTMNLVGLYRYQVRNSSGTVIQTVWGSTSNGLLKANSWYHVSDRTITVVSGNTYYCTVTFIAKDSNGSDTRTMSTVQVTAP